MQKFIARLRQARRRARWSAAHLRAAARATAPSHADDRRAAPPRRPAARRGARPAHRAPAEVRRELQPRRPRLARAVPHPRGRRHAARARRGVLQGQGPHGARRRSPSPARSPRRSPRSCSIASSAPASTDRRCSATCSSPITSATCCRRCSRSRPRSTALISPGAPARARLGDRRVLRRHAAVGVGHGDARARGEPRDDLPRHRDDVDRRLRDDGDAPARRAAATRPR